MSYTAYYYDAAGRTTDVVDVGTNGTNGAYTRPGSAPARSGTALVSSFTYDAAGRQDTVTDPRGLTTQTSYDLLGRTMQTTEAYNSGAAANDAAWNRTTTYAYDGNDQVVYQTAKLSPFGQADQTTWYERGVTHNSGSAIDSNGLLYRVHYPDPTAGTGGTNAANYETYAYDSTGAPTAKTDRNGNVHAYGYDVLGRTTSDTITTLGSGVDGSVRRLGYGYDTAGRPSTFTSYSNTNGATVVNQVQRQYNGLGQLITEYQEQGAAIFCSVHAARRVESQWAVAWPLSYMALRFIIPAAWSRSQRAPGRLSRSVSVLHSASVGPVPTSQPLARAAG